MQGLGNDFVILDGLSQTIDLDSKAIATLGDRRLGVGFDQLLIISRPTNNHADLAYRIFNADGSLAGQCGNGARCVARYFVDHHEAKDHITMESPGGMLEANLMDSSRVRLNMGEPRFNPESIPLNLPPADTYHFDFLGKPLEFGAVSMGNPHAVLPVGSVEDAAVSDVAHALAKTGLFPDGVNVGFMQVIDRNHLWLRVHERGVGETQACGTGACAAMAVARSWNLIDNESQVQLPGGVLSLEWGGSGHDLHMTGPAEYVFDGRIDL